MRNCVAVVCLLAVLSAAPALRAQDDRPKNSRQNNFRFGAGIVFRFG